MDSECMGNRTKASGTESREGWGEDPSHVEF